MLTILWYNIFLIQPLAAKKSVSKSEVPPLLFVLIAMGADSLGP